MRPLLILCLLAAGCSEETENLLDAEPGRDVPGDAGVKDTGRPDTGVSADANEPDAAGGMDAEMDAGAPDADELDAGEPDATEMDATEMDATEMDATEMDAAEMDAAEMDAAEMDAAEMDAAEMDAMEMDAGTPDTGDPGMVIVSPTAGLVTDESGAADSFTVELSRAPTSTVTLSMASSDPGEGQPSPMRLMFLPANWSIPQVVTVSGIGDLIVDPDQMYSVVTSTTTSLDPAFAGLVVDDVAILNLDVPSTCFHILTETATAATGSYAIDPDGHGAVQPFAAFCDMTSDDGGWTLLGRGAWWNGADITLPAGSNTMLPNEVTAAVGASSTRLYRAGSAAQRFYIFDLGARVELSFHYWRTDAPELSCGTSYAAVTGGTMAMTNVSAVNCDPLGVGFHTCGFLNGWILLHRNDTYNIDGNHPCTFGAGELPTAGALRDLWVR